MADEPRKRSRFDQTETDSQRKSRLDRRSRSPPPLRRSRSPGAVSSPSTIGGKNDTKDIESTSKSPAPVADPKAAAAAAAAAAARINAQLKDKLKTAGSAVSRPAVVAKQLPKKDASGIYQENGDYQKDIEINHLRNRYTLTKGAFQKMIKEQTGADVTTKGEYVPDSNTANITAPPLYLQITAQTKDALEQAVKLIEEEMDKDLPNLIDERRFRGRREQEDVERDDLGRRKFPEERLPIPFEPIPGFNLRAQVVGSQGSYVKFIQHETSCRVQIKGRGSGFIEVDTNRESDEQMYLHISGRQKEQVDRAKELALELLQNVKKQYDQFKANGPSYGGRGGGGHRQGSMGGGFSGGGHGSPPGMPSGGYGGNGAYNQAYGSSGSPPPPPPPSDPAPAQSGSPQDYSQQWQQYYAQYAQQDPNDPYAAFGGRDNYMQYYAQFYAQGQPQAPVPGAEGTGTPTAGYGYGAPPGASSAPPPPPPPPDAGGYNAVPPPPGM